MQTIIKTAPQFDFSQISNDLLESQIPAKAQKVLLYLLSKPANWQIRFNDIKHRLGMSSYGVRQALKWLLDNGYAIFDRLKSGHTIWRIFDKPQATDTLQTRVVEPHVENPRVENQHALVTLSQSEILKTTTTPPAEIEPIVVVFEEKVDEVKTGKQPDLKSEVPRLKRDQGQDLKSDPIPHVEPKHQPAARKALAGLTPEQITAIMLVFNMAVSKGGVANPIGYLISLTRAARTGSFSPVEAARGVSMPTLAERIAKEREKEAEARERGAMSNEQHAEWLERMYGQSAPKQSPGAGKSIKQLLGWS